MTYKELKTVFHQFDQARAEAEEQARRASPAAIHWDFFIGDCQMFCLVTPKITALIERIMTHAAHAQFLWERLPGGVQGHYLRSMIVEEIYATNQIEAVFSTRQEIADVLEAMKDDSVVEGRRFREMVRLYADLSVGPLKIPASLEDIRAIYDDVTNGEIDVEEHPDGKLFRTKPVVVTDGVRTVHRGMSPESTIASGLAEMLRQSRDEAVPSLIRSVVAHFIFEYVHPFYDGNGRTGRYLLEQDLAQYLSRVAWLSICATISDNKNRYYRAFKSAENPLNRGDITVFVMEMLDIIREAEGRLCDDLEQRTKKLEVLGDRIMETIESSRPPLSALQGKERSVLFIIAQASVFGIQGVISLESIAESLEKTKQYVRPITRRLVDDGLVEEVSKRPLRFRLAGVAKDLLLSSDEPEGPAQP